MQREKIFFILKNIYNRQIKVFDKIKHKLSLKNGICSIVKVSDVSKNFVLFNLIVIFFFIFIYNFRLILGTLYPAYKSYKAIKNKDVREHVS